MIQVAVSQQDLRQHEVVFGDGGQQLVCLATGIDERRLAGLVTPDEGAVLGKGSDRNDLKFQHIELF
ncbi:hypothetical protein D3C80_2028620 [compost metagenome]